MRQVTRFEVVAALAGAIGGASIGLLWWFAPSVLAKLPTLREVAEGFGRRVPWTGYFSTSVFQQFTHRPVLVGLFVLLLILLIMRPLGRFFGEGQ